MSVALCAAVACVVVSSRPVSAQEEPVAYGLTAPATVSVGGTFTLCMEGLPGSTALLVVGTELGSTPTKWGTLCVQLPALAIIPFQISSSGQMCFPCDLPCHQYLVGLSLHMTAIMGNGLPGGAVIADCTSIGMVDGGLCVGGPTPGTEPGDFVSYTQGAYGAACTGGNPACTLAEQWDAVFPNGLLLGDPDGLDGDANHALLLTSAAAVTAFLPEGTPRSPFDQDLVDPVNSSAGVLGGQLATAKINVALDAAGVFDAQKAYPGIALGDLVYVGGVEPVLIGKTVHEVLAIADQAVASLLPMPADLDGDTLPDLSFAQLNTAVELVNTNFDNGSVSLGFLAAP